jgi:hypothetical protein
MPQHRGAQKELSVHPGEHIRHHRRIAHVNGMRRTAVIPQIEREHVEMLGQIAPRRLPVPRRTQHPVKDDQWRFAGPAQFAMRKLYGRTQRTPHSNNLRPTDNPNFCECDRL